MCIIQEVIVLIVEQDKDRLPGKRKRFSITPPRHLCCDILVSGVILIVLGIYVKFRGAVLTKVLRPSSVYLFHVSYLCLVMGCLTTVLLGFPVWYGTTEESREILLFGSHVAWGRAGTPSSAQLPSPLRVFQSLLWMVVILTVEITVATLVLAFLPTAPEESLEYNFVSLKKNYRGYNEPDDFSTEWNLVMEKLKCCGVKSYTDFSGSSFEKMTGYTYPRSCCKSIGTAACTGHNVSSDVIHQAGCFPKLLKIVTVQNVNLSLGSLGAAVMQVSLAPLGRTTLFY
ncbi:Tetraspanin-16 [Myotis davidii]|uniref:Tetraspanin n=1 Tax=Myotis davidii TaxID=225400 RepID=L5LQJ9_MYODS|nr:Tetraspanin-16 [Myotis davidii]